MADSQHMVQRASVGIAQDDPLPLQPRLHEMLLDPGMTPNMCHTLMEPIAA
jgi:hypothetical protein